MTTISPDRPRSSKQFKAPWSIFWVAFGLRVAVILVGHTYRIRTDQANFNFGFEAGRIARSVVWGQGYSNPFNGVSGPTAWLPPLYPLLIAAAFKVFGVYTRAAGLALLVMNSLFSAGVAPAVYEIAARCFDAKGVARRGSTRVAPVALWAAWVWAVYPAALQYAIHWVWEMSLTAFLFAWVVVVALRLRGVGAEHTSGAEAPDLSGAMKPEAEASGYLEARAAPNLEANGAGFLEASAVRLWAGFGGLWGLVALSNASLLLCFPAMMIWVVWPDLVRRVSSRQLPVASSLRRNLVGMVLACIVFGAVMTPWVVRNERVLHGFVLTRGNLGIELYESTLERNDGFPWGTTLSLWPGDAEFKRYVAMGEVRYSAMMGAEAKRRILARPWRTARWTVDRFFFFWDGTPHADKPVMEFLRQLSYCFISACGLLGMALMLWRRVEGAGLLALIFVLLPLPYYLVTVQPRFRHPMEPLIAVLAVYLFRSAERQ